MSEIKRNSNRHIFDFFRSRLTDLSDETAIKYRRTISELDFFTSGHQICVSNLSRADVCDWTTELLRQDLSKSTVTRHLNILSGLIRSAAAKNILSPDDSPRKIARYLEESVDHIPPLLNDRIFNATLSTLRDILSKDSGHDTFEDMLLLSLLNGAIPLEDVAKMKKTDSDGLNEASMRIIERNSMPNRAFIFDLRQSYRTPRQIRAAINEGLIPLLGKLSLPSSSDPDCLTRSIWAACALRCGATASEALAALDASAPLAIPSFCIPCQNVADRRGWEKSVASMLDHRLPGWYAMHIRKGIRFEELKKEISETVRPVPELFYPVETIRKRIGKRTVIEEHPFISTIVFFKSRQENILPMFSRIGDKAWCYRVSNSPGAPYAAISSHEMRRFQAAIGVFTPDIEIHRLGELTPRPGESVIVIKAGYGNREGELEEIINDGSGSAIFRVKLSTDQGYEWRMDVDARQIQRIPASK